MPESLVTKSKKIINPIGIGTWNICSQRSNNASSKYGGIVPEYGQEDQAIEALRYSLSLGQNHIDCAEVYGGFYTDEVVGRALSGQKREDLFIADKLWRTSIDSGLVRPTVEKMLKKLGTDYLDVLYIHAPWPDLSWQNAIHEINSLIDEGVVRYFGVSNFAVEDLEKALRISQHPIAANQVNYNLLYQIEANRIREYCDRHKVKIVAYQPLKRGEIASNKTVLKIAREYSSTPSQIALAWLLNKDILAIPKALSKSHIDENWQAQYIRLNSKTITQLNSLAV